MKPDYALAETALRENTTSPATIVKGNGVGVIGEPFAVFYTLRDTSGQYCVVWSRSGFGWVLADWYKDYDLANAEQVQAVQMNLLLAVGIGIQLEAIHLPPVEGIGPFKVTIGYRYNQPHTTRRFLSLKAAKAFMRETGKRWQAEAKTGAGDVYTHIPLHHIRRWRLKHFVYVYLSRGTEEMCIGHDETPESVITIGNPEY